MCTVRILLALSSFKEFSVARFDLQLSFRISKQFGLGSKVHSKVVDIVSLETANILNCTGVRYEGGRTNLPELFLSCPRSKLDYL